MDTSFAKLGETVQRRQRRVIKARYITIVKYDKEKIKVSIKTTALSVTEISRHDQIQTHEKRRDILLVYISSSCKVHRPKQHGLFYEIPEYRYYFHTTWTLYNTNYSHFVRMGKGNLHHRARRTEHQQRPKSHWTGSANFNNHIQLKVMECLFISILVFLSH